MSTVIGLVLPSQRTGPEPAPGRTPESWGLQPEEVTGDRENKHPRGVPDLRFFLVPHRATRGTRSHEDQVAALRGNGALPSARKGTYAGDRREVRRPRA